MSGPPTIALPGNVRMNPLRYLRYFPTAIVIPGAFALATFAFPFLAGLSYWPVILVGIAAVVGQFVKPYRHFMYGTLSPAVVLQIKPLILAVYTDLSDNHRLSVPVVKIVRHPRLRSDRFAIGQRCVTVSLYQPYDGFRERQKWKDFEPLLVSVATSDPAISSNALRCLPDDDWFMLEQFVLQLPKPPSLGLHQFAPNLQRN